MKITRRQLRQLIAEELNVGVPTASMEENADSFLQLDSGPGVTHLYRISASNGGWSTHEIADRTGNIQMGSLSTWFRNLSSLYEAIRANVDETPKYVWLQEDGYHLTPDELIARAEEYKNDMLKRFE